MVKCASKMGRAKSELRLPSWLIMPGSRSCNSAKGLSAHQQSYQKLNYLLEIHVIHNVHHTTEHLANKPLTIAFRRTLGFSHCDGGCKMLPKDRV
ncbi:hypothetical protein Mapa_015418 [Marchantia paleacea]|nr:hypothetical protein Mapa_015418 [Marchantia paleacea]